MLAKRRVKKQLSALFSFDKPLFFIVLVWVVFGFVVFVSASFGFLYHKNSAILSSLLAKQLFFIFLGLVIMFFISRARIARILDLAPYFYIVTLILSILVFIPGLSFSHGGAHRWINVLGFSFQPAELFKISVPLFFAYLWKNYAGKIKNQDAFLALPALAVFLPGVIMLVQPDTSTTLVVLFAVSVMYFLLGAPKKHILYGFIILFLVMSFLVYTRPYVKDRILVFLNLKDDKLGSSYQINQSTIAVGSGGIFGKGLGQGTQKYGYLPEPAGDSVFATLAEEFGFVGSTVFLLIILMFVLRSFKLAKKARNSYSAILIVSFASIIFIQSALNIGAMIKLLPLTGLTLPFVSLGGSSMLVNFALVGLIFAFARR